MLRTIVGVLWLVVLVQLMKGTAAAEDKKPGRGKCVAACADKTSNTCTVCNEQAASDFSAKTQDAKDKASAAVATCGAKADRAAKMACMKEQRAALKATVQPEGQQETKEQRISRMEKLVAFEEGVAATERLELANAVKTTLLNAIKANGDGAAIEEVKEEMCSRCANADAAKKKICVQKCFKKALVEAETENLKTCFSAASTTDAKSACFCKDSADDDQLDKIAQQGKTRKVKAALDFICDLYADCTATGASDCSDKLEADVTVAKGGCASGAQKLKGNSQNIKAKCEQKRVGDVQGRCKAAMQDNAATATTDEQKMALQEELNQCIKDATGLPAGKCKKLEMDSEKQRITEEMIACKTCEEEAAKSGVATNCPEKSQCADIVKALIKEEFGSDCEGNYQALVQDDLAVAEEDAAGTDQVLDVPKMACEVLISFKQGKGQCRPDGTMRPGLKEKMTEKASKVDGVGKAAKKTKQVERAYGTTTVQETVMSFALEEAEPGAEMTEDEAADEIEQKCEQFATSLKAGARRLAELDTSDLDEVTATQATQSCPASDTSCQSSELDTSTDDDDNKTYSGTAEIGLSLFVSVVLATMLQQF